MRSFSLTLAASLALATGCARPSFDDARAGRAPRAPSRDVVPGGPDGPSVPAPSSSTTGGGVRVFSSANGSAVCGDDLAATTFRFAMCLCEDAAFAADVETSSFSSSDPSAPVAGGGLGANGSISAAGSLDIGGSLAAGGDLTPVGSVDVRDDLRAGGDVAFVGAGTVGGDAFVAGNVTTIGLELGGTLHANEASRVIGVTDVVRESVSIDPPCACGDDQRTDVVGIVAAARTDNDNAANAIDAGSLTDVAGDIELSLPAGRFLFDGVRAAGAVRIAVSGPAAVFVDGDIALAGELEVILDGADASLDLFILGDLAAAGALDIGSAASPAKVRVYVGGDGDIAIAGAANLGASLFAPDARVALAGSFTFDGALVANSIAQAGTLKVRYDADVLDGAGLGCEPTPPEGGDDTDPPAGDDGAVDPGEDDGAVDPGEDGGAGEGEGNGGAGDDAGDGTGNPGDDVGNGACDTVADCGNQACIDGTCGACESTLDCAAPLTCLEGACIPLTG